MIAQELEVSLHMAFVEARQARHEFITVEHLLLALLDNPSAAEVLCACACNIEDLRETLWNFVADNSPMLAQSSEADTQPTLGFQRVIQRAVMHVQSTSNGKKEVTGADVLVAILGEKDSHAVYYLHQQGVTRLDVVNFISHGIAKAAQGGRPRPSEPAPEGTQRPEASSADLEELIVRARDGKTNPLIGRAIMEARQARHEFVTVEHLLLGLLEDATAVQVLRAWACDVEGLRKRLVSFLSDSMAALPRNSESGTRPAPSFVRAIQQATRAAIVRDMAHAQCGPGGKAQPSSADVLAGILEQEHSYAATCLRSCTPDLRLWADSRDADYAGGPS